MSVAGLLRIGRQEPSVLAEDAGGAGGTVFVSDSFTDVDGTGLVVHAGQVGATWALHPSSNVLNTVWAISDLNRCRPNNNNGLVYASGVPASAEYDVEAVFRCITNIGGTGIAGRMDTVANSMYLVHRADASTWTLFKGVAGVFTSLGTFAQALTVGQDYAVKLQIRDAAKKVFIDGVERISSVDNVVTGAGRAGVRGFATSTNASGVHLDSLTATNA